MTKLTLNEATVVKAIRDICFDDVDATAEDIAEATGFPIRTVVGVLGSLAKKHTDLIAIGTGEYANTCIEYDCVNYVDKNGSLVSFGCDRDDSTFHTDEEIDALVK